MREPRRIVILTGAGVSAESGVKTFRESGGLWEEHSIEDVATPEGFGRDPKLVLDFYNARRAQLKEVGPNDAHKAIARLEKEYKGQVLLVTQNVDNLHERAGSKNIIHMHGKLTQMRCMKSGKVFETEESFYTDTKCSCCNEAGNLRPNIVWFGEMPFMLEEIDDALSNCDLFISIGTSGLVYPAAGFVQVAKFNPYCKAVEFNIDRTSISSQFDEHIIGPAGEEVSKFVEKLLSGV